MKHVFTLIILLSFFFTACRKEQTAPIADTFLKTVQAGLGDSLSTVDYAQLNFKKIVLTKVDSINLYVLRIPFLNKSLQTDFIILKTSSIGIIQEGKIVHLEGAPIEIDEGRVKRQVWNGKVSIAALDRKKVLNSRISNGYIEAFHPQAVSRIANLPAPEYQDLPEVIVISSGSSGDVSISSWFLLQSLFTSIGNESGGYYGSLDGGGGYYGGGGGSTGGGYSGGSGGGYSGGGTGGGGGDVILDPPILIDQEYQVQNDAIDIQKFVNCFSSIPDAGATCSMEILADIPVDGKPSDFFNWQTGSPGHTFIKLRKSNGTESVQQIFGWYPQSGYKTMLTSAPISGKFVNNELHEYNASLTMNLTPAQLQTAITRVLYLARFIKYDIDDYNCTDFALDVFNETVAPAQRLELTKYDIPGGTAPNGTNTPNGLYQKLQAMSAAGNGGIDIPGKKGWVGHSNGPCN